MNPVIAPALADIMDRAVRHMPPGCVFFGKLCQDSDAITMNLGKHGKRLRGRIDRFEFDRALQTLCLARAALCG